MKDSNRVHIEGGYYIKARCIQDSEVAHAPPHVREIWDWLLKEANHTDKKVSGILIRRGQCVRTYKDIQEGLHWMIGWRKKTYKKHECEFTMKWLTKRVMITTRKTTRGMIITICNYDFYQNPKHYESHSENHNKATMKPQTTDTINKNDKNERNKNKQPEATLGFLDTYKEEIPQEIVKSIAVKVDTLKSIAKDSTFEPRVFVAKCVKSDIPAELTNHVLGELIKHSGTISNFWGYAIKILKREEGNYHYAKQLERHYAYKEEEIATAKEVLKV